MNYTFKATEVNKSFGAHSYTCSEKVGSSQGDSTYIFRSYQKSSTIRDHTLHIDNRSGIFYKAKPTRGAFTRLGIRYERAHDEMLLTNSLMVRFNLELMCTLLQK